MNTTDVSSQQLTPPALLAPGLLKGKVLLVTGGGTGIGKQVALLAVKAGAAAIAICGRRLEPLQNTAKEIAALGAKVYYESCDLRNAEQVESFVSNVVANVGTIDVLINNAGGQFLSAAVNISPKGFEAVIRNNLLVTFNVTKAVAKAVFIPSRKGSIVSVTAQVKAGFPGMVHTGAARAGVENMTMSLAVEWATYGIRINSIAPGVIISDGINQYPKEFLEKAHSKTLVGRLGTSEEVAALILYVASDITGGFINGQTFYIDGGQSLNGPFFSLDLVAPPNKAKI